MLILIHILLFFRIVVGLILFKRDIRYCYHVGDLVKTIHCTRGGRKTEIYKNMFNNYLFLVLFVRITCMSVE